MTEVRTLSIRWALVHSVDGGRDDPSPGPLCDDPLATDRFRASCQQHPVQDDHADGSLGLLGSEAAGSQPWSDQRFVGKRLVSRASQGNRVKLSRSDKACQEVVIPGGDFSPHA